MRETVTPWKFRVEGEAGSESDERIGAARGWAGDRGRGEGDPAAVHRYLSGELCGDIDSNEDVFSVSLKRLHKIYRHVKQVDGAVDAMRIGALQFDLPVIDVCDSIKPIQNALRDIVGIEATPPRVKVVDPYLNR
jgi:hypothetical protein